MTTTYTAPQQVQWLIQDIAASYEALIADKDAEIEGLEDAEREAQSELESVRNDLNAAENALENLETEALDNARACLEALKYHGGLPVDFPELVALEKALNGEQQ